MATKPSPEVLQTLLEIGLDLCANLATTDRYARLAQAVLRVVPCDATAILRREADTLVPVAIEGLVPETFGRRFVIAEHPRLERILGRRAPTRFVDSRLPDPFDGLLALPRGATLDVHSCMGCPLVVAGEVVGVVTFDAARAGAFEDVSDELVSTLAALAAAAVRTAGFIGGLEAAAQRCGRIVQELRAEAEQRAGGEILGVSVPMCLLREEIELSSKTDLAVLVTGETGVGKELVARAVHAGSERADGPLIYVNCAALPETLAESELFGHVRGAFTGATAVRAGKFEAAHGGTLFLDEIGELPPSVQPVLLRVLQTGEIQRVGSDRMRRVDVRVIAATNRDLEQEVADGRFRADLFHRLSVYPIHIPPLRERMDDVAVLTGHFLDATRVRLGVGRLRLTAAAREALAGYDWPGNVRELEHTLLRAAVRGAGGRRHSDVMLDVEHLRLPVSGPTPSNVLHLGHAPDPQLPLREAVEAFQRQRIRETLRACGGNWAAASRRLGLDRGNLHRLARRLGLRE